jgi:hypothetical protein
MEKILSVTARLDDAAAINALLAPLRDSRSIKRRLRPGFCGHKYSYYRHTRTAHYLLTDGEIVACYSVTDVSLDQAATIAVACESITDWSLGTFQAAVEHALGAEAAPAMSPRH